MRHRRDALKAFALWLALSVGACLYLCALRAANDAPLSWKHIIARLVAPAMVLLAARWTRPRCDAHTKIIWPWSSVAVAGLGGAVTISYALNHTTWTAWAMVMASYVLLLGLERALSYNLRLPGRWGVRVALALTGGFIPVAIAQIESHFADEEFLVAVQSLALSLLWLLVLAGRHMSSLPGTVSKRRGIQIDRRWLSAALAALALVGVAGTVHSYQSSFYPTEVPRYPGVSREDPFVCGEADSNSRSADGEHVFRRLLRRVEANPRKRAPEYGMLALGTGERRWASAFRKALLDEAERGLYTKPAGSVKSVQHQAALRAYYFPRVRDAFPTLFTSKDLSSLQEWFAAINRRALTVEWVDWMYALAFNKRPEGPYGNQESGAGLLALLEAEALAAPDLSSANRDYLMSSQRGWLTRFRNTDDAFVYQLEWIDNAYFQSLFKNNVSRQNVAHSFEWLLVQALPDGSRLRYNHPARPSIAGIAYLGATLLDDPRYLWLADTALREVEEEERYLFAQPGVEAPVHFDSQSPSVGSCLLYGDSGLPNQVGPLAPDKIVFRDGWSHDASYLLLNLRFSGWHRYKASNTITLAYHDMPLVNDVLSGETPGWLPEGRSLFRDKRIPRENLNGVLVPRTGMSAVLHAMTGIGSPWAQDPPRYAEVVGFETGDDFDWSHTRLTDWRGWQHDRQIYFYHDGGPVVILDRAIGPPRERAALAWHFGRGTQTADQRIRLQSDKHPTEIALIPTGSEGEISVAKECRNGNPGLRVVYYGSDERQVTVATVFLTGSWVGSELSWDAQEHSLELLQESGKHLTLPAVQRQ